MLWPSKLIQIQWQLSVRECLFLITFIALIALSLWVGIGHMREQAADSQCQANIRWLAVNFDGYKLSYGCLPPPFISDQFGKPLYSWRVLIAANNIDSREFDYTKPWDDPVNMQVANKGHNEASLKIMFCPSMKHEKSGQTDYFYVLNSEERWPRDFFIDANSRPKIVLVESQWRDVYWSEPVDFVYEKSQGFLNKLRETKPPHPGGYNCVSSDLLSFKIPYSETHLPDSLINSSFFWHRAKEVDGAGKERIDQLVAKLMKALGDPPKTTARTPLLLLSELGPQAAAAVPMIRRIRDEGDKRLQPIAVMALARIEK